MYRYNMWIIRAQNCALDVRVLYQVQAEEEEEEEEESV